MSDDESPKTEQIIEKVRDSVGKDSVSSKESVKNTDESATTIEKYCGRYDCLFCRSDISLYRLNQHLKTKMCQLFRSGIKDSDELIKKMQSVLDSRKQEYKDRKKAKSKKFTREYVLDIDESEIQQIPEEFRSRIKKI